MARLMARLMVRSLPAMAAVLVTLVGAGCYDATYQCTSNDNCVRGGVGGYCEPYADGRYCMFPDNGCPTHARWDTTAASDVAGRCVTLACDDGVSGSIPTLENGAESDVDCGGPCPACRAGLRCRTKADCASRNCVNSVCAAPTCQDGIRNGEESSEDCGGGCKGCESGFACKVNSDCVSDDCREGICKAPQCYDGLRNGGETDIDCGGTTGCPACQVGGKCKVGPDCGSGSCTSGTCDGLPFKAATQLDAGDKATMLQAIDVTGDGKIDLVVYNDIVGKPLIILQGDGAGGFKKLTTTVNTKVAAHNMVSGDFDMDGRPDLVLPSETDQWEVALLHNAGNEVTPLQLVEPGLAVRLTSPSFGAAVGDFNGDRIDDVAFTLSNNHLGFLYGGLGGVYKTNYVDVLPPDAILAMNAPSTSVPRLLALDIDKDGDQDLAYLNRKSGVTTLINSSNNNDSFTVGQQVYAAGGAASDLRSGRVDGDDIDDLVLVDSSGNVVALLADGKGTFNKPFVARGAQAMSVVLADMNGDGYLDAVASAVSRGVQVLLGDNKGNLVRSADLGLPSGNSNVRHLVVADFDGDNKPDVAATTDKLDNKFVYVWLRP